MGWLLFELASLRAKVLSRGVALLLIIGAVIFLILGVLSIPMAGVVYGAVAAWLGFALWFATSEPTLQAEAAR